VAIQSFDNALKIDPNNIFATLNLAKIFLSQGKIDKAKAYANKVLTIDDKTIATYFVLAEIANQQKDSKELERVLLVALEKAKTNEAYETEVFKTLIKLYTATKEPAKIKNLAEDMVKRYPGNSFAENVLAQILILQNKKPEAEKVLKKFISQNKTDINSRLLLARLMMDAPNKKSDVLKLLDETASIAPDKVEVPILKTEYLIRQKNYTEAMELADKIDKQYPELIAGGVLKTNVYLAEHKPDKAISQYQQVFSKQPNNTTLSALIDLMLAQKQTSQAIALLENELKKNQDNPMIHFRLAVLYQQLNDDLKAETHYQAILAKQPENVPALNNLANLYIKTKNPKALELAKKAYTKEPNSPAIADTYGSILVEQGNIKEGLPLLEQAASKMPSSLSIQYHLAVAYAKNNDNKKAIEILSTITKSKQDFSEKKAAIALLEKLKG
jgi:putative PEP-CTERM system TPR-repeat lipoprotein